MAEKATQPCLHVLQHYLIMKWKYRLLLSRLCVGLCALFISSLLSVCFVSSSELAVIPAPLVLSWFTATLNLIIPTCPCSLALISLFYILISFSVIWWIIPSLSPAPACWSSLVLFLSLLEFLSKRWFCGCSWTVRALLLPRQSCIVSVGFSLWM